jgi:hypothetical protein
LPRATTVDSQQWPKFAPFVGGLAVADLTWQGEPIPAGSMVLLDLYGQNHDAALWGGPYTFGRRASSSDRSSAKNWSGKVAAIPAPVVAALARR